MDAKNVKNKVIAIVGGGAAGMMAAYFAKLHNSDSRVILIEKNTYLGAKVIISGGGRCNVTTGIVDPNEVLKNYPRGSDFLKTAIYNFPPEAVMNWFESQGVPLKTEADLRVFPVSNDGHDIVNALNNALKDLNVEILLNTAITDISASGENFVLISKSGQKIEANRLILTTGGHAYRHTGSTGDGYHFAQELGHTITELAPSLSSFYTAEKWPAQISGISFKKATITFTSTNGSTSFTRTGPFLFTHKGVSGPAIFALSGYAAYQKFDNNKPAKLAIDLFPDQSSQDLEKQIDQLIEKNPAKKTVNLIDLLLPNSFATILAENLNLTNIRSSDLSRSNRQKIVNALKALPLNLIGRGAGDEFVTAGGIPQSEINPKSMESRLHPGLFFAGEIIDVDGFTGGFNLQASWATGALAGEHL
ncbi:NAD(P)/FAD-dependent oxidoreductase [Candidatus Peregrinibacteria bacterium]|nr:NAD(P)/FAD-dependent oxidoreductase [Candidatus Peregrinibacteria bacterium]